MAIAFVNSTSILITGGASTWSIATHSSLEGGAAFIVGVSAQSSAISVDTVTDNAGNVYRVAAQSTQSGRGAITAALWYATNISSLSTRVSVTWTGSSTGSLAVGQWRGVSTQSALLTAVSSINTVASSVHRAGTEFTPSSDGALVVAYNRSQASTINPVVVDGGMSSWVTTGRVIGMYEIQTVASTVSGQWRTNAAATSTGLTLFGGVLAAFSDTQAVPVGGESGYANGLCLLGVQ